MAQPTFNEKLQQIKDEMRRINDQQDLENPAAAHYAASMLIVQLCRLLSTTYPQDVQNTVNQIVSDLNAVANAS